MARYLTEGELRERLQQSVDASCTDKQWAQVHSVDEGVLSMALSGKRPISDTMAAILGYTKVIRYIKTPKEG